MGLELDHVFIFVSEGAPEAEVLLEFGFKEGEPNVHPGQGTSCRRFFFNNMMLELIWVSDFEEVKNELTKTTMLWERWSGRHDNVSPFGIIVRSSDEEDLFEGWEYKPDYLPEGLSFL
ncbi:MAG: VOC family protein [Desulfobacteraceae bacterium]|nr:VOC family protein [Desulfobacteraceae bacterium]